MLESVGGVGIASISDLIRLPSLPAFPLSRQLNVFLFLLLIIRDIQLYSPVPKHDPPVSPGNSDNHYDNDYWYPNGKNAGSDVL